MNKDKMSGMSSYFDDEYLCESGLHSRGSLYREKYVVVKAEAAFRDYAFYLFLCDKNHTAEDAVKSLSPSTFEEIENDEETYCADEKYIVFLKDTEQKKYGYPVYADLYGNTGNLINVYRVIKK